MNTQEKLNLIKLALESEIDNDSKLSIIKGILMLLDRPLTNKEIEYGKELEASIYSLPKGHIQNTFWEEKDIYED